MKKKNFNMKKNITLSCVLIGSLFSNLAFANYPVIDLSNLLYSIEQVSTMYQQINQTVEQLRNQYEQIKQTAIQMATLDLSSFKNIGDNFNGLDSGNAWERTGSAIGATKKTAEDIVKAVNKELDEIDRFEHALTDKNISFGEMDVSYADLCGCGEPGNDVFDFMNNAADSIGKTCDDIGKSYSEGLTPEEKIAIMYEYGMSPKNYAKIKASEAMLSNVLIEANVEGTETAAAQKLEGAIDEANSIHKIVDDLPDGNMFALSQISARTLASLKVDFSRLTNAIHKQTSLQAQDITSRMVKQAMIDKQKRDEEKKNKSDKSGLLDSDNIRF